MVFAFALYLGLNAGENIARDHVFRLLWPDHDEEDARHSLRQLIYRLRALGVPVEAQGDGVGLPDECVATDFAQLLTSAPSREVYLRVPRFTVLEGYAPTFSLPFANWVEEFRGRLGVALRNGLMACITDARSRGRYRDVEHLARHCLSLDPLNEEATLGLAEATALAGNKVAALRMLDAYQAELGELPGLRLQSDLLRRRIAERLNVYASQPDDVRMLGREDAMEYVLRGVHSLASGRATSLLITGEAGIGKTRLLGEFARAAAMHNVRTVVLRCHPGWREQTLAAVTDLVTTLLELPGALGASPDAMATLRGLTSTVPRSSDMAMYMGDAEATLANLRWSVLDLFEAVMQEKSLVLLVDNVQWLDELSEHFLHYVVVRSAARPLYLVMTSREGPGPGDTADSRPLLETENRLALQSLDDATSLALVRHVVELTGRDLPDASADNCVRRCGGNPYFLSELARYYLVSGPNAEPPVTLRMFIEHRLARVSRAARRVLEVVAILGAYATVRRIGKVLQRTSIRLLDSLEELQATGFIGVSNGSCECRHDIVRELVEARISAPAQRTLHLRSAKVLHRETLANRTVPILLQCGRHLIRSGDTEKAPRGALIIAKQLLRLGAAEAATELATRARELATDPDVRLRSNVTLARAYHAQGLWVECLEVCRALFEQSNERLTIRLQTELRIYAAEARLQTGSVKPNTIDEILTIALSTSLPWDLRLLAVQLALSVADNKWRPEIAHAVAPVMGSMPELPGLAGIFAVISRVIQATMVGDEKTAAAFAEHLLAMRGPHLSPPIQHRCIRIAAHCYFRLGEMEKARKLFTESLASSLAARTHHIAVYDETFLALVSLQDGNAANASALLRSATERAVGIGLKSGFRTLIEVLILEAASECGTRVKLPNHEYRKLLVAAEQLDPRTYQSLLATRLLGMDQRARERYERSRAELHAAVDRYAGTGWQDYPVFVLTSSYATAGDQECARAVLSKYLEQQRPNQASLRPRLRELQEKLGISVSAAPERPEIEP